MGDLQSYRAIAYKTGERVHLRSSNDNDFAVRYQGKTVLCSFVRLS